MHYFCVYFSWLLQCLILFYAIFVMSELYALFLCLFLLAAPAPEVGHTLEDAFAMLLAEDLHPDECLVCDVIDEGHLVPAVDQEGVRVLRKPQAQQPLVHCLRTCQTGVRRLLRNKMRYKIVVLKYVKKKSCR